ncbi:AbiA family abortive infection protein [Pontibacter ummariensis]|uniref:Abortive infection protein, AbiA family n=1 Tax=Pontibacter ummariensis TaxID=1610492 RepID=A0A239IUW2_9BACT|nr:AbiA family abortive infection protein [Pontibacter ummariensis]SNS97162.1 abortive infection protein, AbiA family [Pontibacter ummariensis]
MWLEAKKLLDFQINNKKTNRYYNTLNFFYFESILDKTKKVGTKTYFKEKVHNNLFYALEKEFFFYKYTLPKDGISLRRYFFFGYPMQVFYYAVGIYLLKVSQQFLTDYSRKNHHCFYGGNLKFEKDKLNINSTSTTYYSSYKKFKEKLDQEIRKNANRTIIKVDIQNYFDNISMYKLLTEMLDRVKFSNKQLYNFDKSTVDLIDFYFKFLNEDRDCLPQSDNNVVSSFIGYLYLTLGDLYIEDSINELRRLSPNFLKEYKIIRYVDDIHVSLDFFSPKDDAKVHAARESKFIYDLLNIISDKFYKNLNLRFNSKTEIFDLNKKKDFNLLKNLVESSSAEYPEPNTNTGTSIPDKGQLILDTLERIKALDLLNVIEGKHEIDLTYLNDIYDDKVRAFLQSPQNRIRLDAIFTDFNFDLFRLKTKPLIIILALSNSATLKFENFLESKLHLTTFDRDIIINYLCQNGFNNRRLITKLYSDSQIKDIFNEIKAKKVVNNKLPGYYKIEFSKLKRFKNEISLIEQIRLRTHYERINNYSISLNLLLNEIHLICSLLECKDIKGYEVSDVRAFLTAEGVENSQVIKIATLFDRRNNNPISHSGSNIRIASSITKEEYFGFKNSVDNVLGYLLSKN